MTIERTFIGLLGRAAQMRLDAGQLLGVLMPIGLLRLGARERDHPAARRATQGMNGRKLRSPVPCPMPAPPANSGSQLEIGAARQIEQSGIALARAPAWRRLRADAARGRSGPSRSRSRWM